MHSTACLFTLFLMENIVKAYLNSSKYVQINPRAEPRILNVYVHKL